MLGFTHLMFGILIASLFSFSYPIVLIGALISDIDVLIPFLEHRGFTHSLLFLLFTGGLLRLKDKKKSIMFTIGLVSHLMLDSLSEMGIKLLWPLSANFGFSLGLANSTSTNLLVISMGAVIFLNRKTIRILLMKIKSEKIRKATYVSMASWFIFLLVFSFTVAGSGPPTTFVFGKTNLKKLLNNREEYNGKNVEVEGVICSSINKYTSDKGNVFRIFNLCQKGKKIKVWDLKEEGSRQLSKGEEVIVKGEFTLEFGKPEISYVEDIKRS